MRSLLAAVTLLLALGAAWAAGPTAEQNLMRNGGLEETGPDGLPVGFVKAVYGAQPSIAADTAVSTEGRQSVRIRAERPSDAAVAQDVEVKPGGIYRFSGRVRTRDLVPEPRSWTYGTFQIQDIHGRTIARLKSHRGTSDWTREEVVFRAPADGKVHVVCFFVGFGKGTGTAWFDDLRLSEVTGQSEIVVTAKRLQKEPISPLVYGNFVELLSDLVPSMWAEKLDVGSFEYLRTPEERRLRESRFTFDPKRDPKDRLWRPIGERAHAQWALDAQRPFNGLVSQRIGLASGGSEAGIAQDGIFVEAGESYRFVGHFRQRELTGPVFVELRKGGDVLARETIGAVTADWSRRAITLRPKATATDATFVLRIASPGTVWVDRVSLMPENSVAGWRPDVVEAIRRMKPGVLRWGGSTTEGYDWKKGIGPWESRVPFANRYWGRIDPNTVGIDEFLAFCRAVGAEPLVCVRWSGQKPSDVAEMVEYCNAAATTPLGSLRAKNGHPEPYGVKYWQIGNEVGGNEYDASFAAIAKAMRAVDPAIKILAAFASDELVASAAEWIDYVCPHHYDCANLQATEADIQRHAELIERLGRGRPIKMAVTEWNTTAGDWGPDRGRLWTLQNGIACARYLNLCHRWSDLVKIACRSNISNSYCSGIIQTNNHALYGTPAYYVSRLYALHGGAHPLELGAATPLLGLDVSANLSADGKRLSLCVLNPEKEPATKTVDLTALGKVAPTARVWTIADADDGRDPEATNSFARPERIATRATTLSNAGRRFSYRFPAYSVTVMELGIESRQ
jgi:alpha-N-arabinofuranosidase